MRWPELDGESRRAVPIPLDLVRALDGDWSAAAFVSQLLYWTGKGGDPDRWIYKTDVELTAELMLSRKEQEAIRRRLRDEMRILEERYRRTFPRRLEFRLDLDALRQLLAVAPHGASVAPSGATVAPSGATGSGLNPAPALAETPESPEHRVRIEYTGERTDGSVGRDLSQTWIIEEAA